MRLPRTFLVVAIFLATFFAIRGFVLSGSAATIKCGNGKIETGEKCDDKNTTNGDGCSKICRVESGWTCTGTVLSSCSKRCGNGKIESAEKCDDRNTVSGDGCSKVCRVENGWACAGSVLSKCAKKLGSSSSSSSTAKPCGNGKIDTGEECEIGPGGKLPLGCLSTCKVQQGWQCWGSPYVPTWGCSPTTPKCGDGAINIGMAASEGCDDGNTVSGDGCSATCTIEDTKTCTLRTIGNSRVCMLPSVCGNGRVDLGEQCDTKGGDGCSAACFFEPGWTCSIGRLGLQTVCFWRCGNGMLDKGGETCDDGNVQDGDGCSRYCQVEALSRCGDGITDGAETCDDGGTDDGDGCSSQCTVEEIPPTE